MGYWIRALMLALLAWPYALAAPVVFAAATIFAAASTVPVASASPNPRSVENFSSYRPSAQFSDPIGVGSLYQKSGDSKDYALVVEDDQHFRQRGKSLGVTRYGFAESRLELGSSTGVNLAAVSGITLFGLGDGQWFSPHMGIEPFSSRLTWNTSHDRESFYEWLPMVSIGPQFAASTCRILPLVKGGASVGNLGYSGLLPRFNWAYGTGAHLNCSRFNLGAELIRSDVNPSPIDSGTLDVSYQPSFTDLRFGFRGEALIHRSDRSSLFSDASSSLRQERRVLFVIRMKPF
jgi:hypothetical protein